MSKIKLIVTDLDNTIYNWVDFYVPSFLAMVKKLSEITKISDNDLKASFKRLYQKYHTSEYTFAIQQLDVLEKRHKGRTTKQILEEYGPALHAFRKVRKAKLRLYDGVRETLVTLRDRGKTLVALTDSKVFHAAVQRLRMLEVESLYDGIFAPPDHDFPPGTAPDDVRYYADPEKYKSIIPVKMELDPSIRKPDPRALVIVLGRFGIRPDEAVYIGDSVLRDVLLAQRCGVHDVLASYGRECDPHNYQELLRITHWSEEEIEEEKVGKGNIRPSYEVRHFSQLISVVNRLEGHEGREKCASME